MEQASAACAQDTAFIAVLQDVHENENATNITTGYLRVGLREVDEAASKGWAPVRPCRTFEGRLMQPGESVSPVPTKSTIYEDFR